MERRKKAGMHSSFFSSLHSWIQHQVQSKNTQGLIAWDADLVVAGTAIDGAIILGQEWHLRLGAALGANHRVHFAWSALSTSTHTGRRVAAGRTAGWTTTRLVHQAFLLVELLFTGSEYEVVSAFTALKGFVFEAQLGTSL